MSHTFLVIVFGLLLLPGLLMAFIPMLPAFWVLMAVAVTFGFVDGFVHLTSGNLIALAALFGLSVMVDWSAGLLGAKFGGAAWKSLIYGVVGSILGLLVFPPVGIFVGLFTGVLIGELLRRRTQQEAVHAAAGALLGSLAGVAINVGLAALFIVSFILFAL